LIQTAKQEPITFSSGSTIVLKIVQELLKENNISFKSINSESTPEEKKLIYNKFKQKKPFVQVFMYSPTITVGVSNLNNVKTHFHYDSGNSVNVLASLQMIKRTRSAENIKLYLDERIKYNPTDLRRITAKMKNYYLTDEDGDVIGITPEGKKLAELIRIDNILENTHKEAFKKLLKYQFLLTKENITVNETKITPFMYKLSKIVKSKDIENKIDLFEKYKQMTPEEISDAVMCTFGTTAENEMIKMFEYWKQDKDLKNLNETDPELFEKLIEQEIKSPGTIEAYKELKDIPNLKYVYSKKDLPHFLKKNYKQYKYKKIRNRYYLNKILKDLIFN
jgi:hypothetical protein